MVAPIAMSAAAPGSTSAAPTANSASTAIDPAMQEANDFVNTMRAAIHFRLPEFVRPAQIALNRYLPQDKQVAVTGKWADLPVALIGTVTYKTFGFDAYNTLNQTRLTDQEFLTAREAALPYRGIPRYRLDAEQQVKVATYQTAVGANPDSWWGGDTDKAEAEALNDRPQVMAMLNAGQFFTANNGNVGPLTWNNPSLLNQLAALPVNPDAAKPSVAAPVVGQNALFRIGEESDFTNGGYIRFGSGISRYRSLYGEAHDGEDRTLRNGNGNITNGKPIYNLFDNAVVLNAGRITGYGNSVQLLDRSTCVAAFSAHYGRTVVNRGDVLTRGDVIGYGGGTGRTTAPSTHWEWAAYRDGAWRPLKGQVVAERLANGGSYCNNETAVRADERASALGPNPRMKANGRLVTYTLTAPTLASAERTVAARQSQPQASGQQCTPPQVASIARPPFQAVAVNYTAMPSTYNVSNMSISYGPGNRIQLVSNGQRCTPKPVL